MLGTSWAPGGGKIEGLGGAACSRCLKYEAIRRGLGYVAARCVLKD